ncbi:flavin reductase family protein [Ohtaekwangia koreensis]|uniref:NADH-FMN oxidoreductase RutF, flavin reductase (DIM6/NTAB) family n=1 Tax=Ohtaekwangia koreensis TaxID=688867 RepID=A0A1T5MDY6_9BACT|nr:flavin reductase family protein [Ohtaekwangia koreensis]SKC86451.1 NADH-FMN oxidoreductase RutF, flavin reductase (DIM6/NTAB) family [Ohtaekwangia koreensis]
MLTIDPKEIPSTKLHAYLLGAVTPRPIAFASTVDKDGNVNLSPFSFFNCFGSNPPLLIFSPARRGRDNTTKHTYDNVLEVQEVVINVVNYSMVQQASLASTEYPKGINEFVKAGFTEVPSTLVKPPRVSEAPIAMECKVLQVVPTGTEGGAGNLVICEVVLMHIKEEALDADGKIDPFKLDAVARLGGDWYCRVQGDAIFSVPKPLNTQGIGVDNIPPEIRFSKILTGNDLGLLGNIERLPDVANDREFIAMYPVQQALQAGADSVHTMARIFLSEGKIEDAWKILLLSLKK